jgi:O-antigen ligase
MDLSFKTIMVSRLLMYRAFFALIVVALLTSVYVQSYLPFILPASILGFAAIIQDYRKLFYILIAILPFSIEFYFEGVGLGTDLPSEPLMMILMGITVAVLLRQRLSLPKTYVFHPLMIMMMIHIFWIFITSINAEDPLISFKFFLAKLWYFFPFFLLPLLFMRTSEEFEKVYRILFFFLFYVILIVLFRHMLEGFSFTSSYSVVRPFFRNHVTYAAISVICLPFVWAFYKINKINQLTNKWIGAALLIFVIGIYFSFTRAAILSMIFAIGARYIIVHKLVKQALIVSSLVAIIGTIYLSWDNKYMDFAPDFERTITHTEFDNLLEATYKLEDISSMERVYRWMAGIEMIKDRFWLGFGPGNFYSNYKSYSISRFQTYVSDNPDHSGIHNYFLMTWVEQGFIGFIILIALCFLLLIEGERLYHIAYDKRDQYLILASTLGFIIIFAMCLINDLLETDKVGPFFMFNGAILLFFANKYKQKV